VPMTHAQALLLLEAMDAALDTAKRRVCETTALSLPEHNRLTLLAAEKRLRKAYRAVTADLLREDPMLENEAVLAGLAEDTGRALRYRAECERRRADEPLL
jgi:hypothetical protein